MAKGKNVLTTGDVARICNVAPRTVSKWFDSGQLRGYRIPGSKDRRIPLNELVRFMKANNMPTDALPAGKTRILVVDHTSNGNGVLAEHLSHRANYEVQTAASSFETGAAVQRHTPHVVLINLMANDIDAHAICRSIRENEAFETVKIFALGNHLSHQETAALMQRGYDGYIPNPSNADEVVQKIEEAVAIAY